MFFCPCFFLIVFVKRGATIKFSNLGLWLKKFGFALSLIRMKCFGGTGMNYLADPKRVVWSPRIFCDESLLRFLFIFTSSPFKQWKWCLLLPRICFVFRKSATSFIKRSERIPLANSSPDRNFVELCCFPPFKFLLHQGLKYFFRLLLWWNEMDPWVMK